MRKKNPFPGVTRSVDRHGGVRWRFRKGTVDTYLPGAYGSLEFRTAYEAALKGAKLPVIRTNAAYGTFAWLIEHYMRSGRFLDLSDARRKSSRGLLDWIREKAGDLPFNRFAVKHVEGLMNKKTGPSAANGVKKTLSILFRYAIKHELCGQKVNPAAFADRRKENTEGFHTWTDAEIAKFLDHHGPGTKARLALMIFLCTGAARQDAAAMGWQNVKDGRIRYKRGKTGVEADLPIMPDLAEALAIVPRDQLLFLTHGKGRGYAPESLGNWFRLQCVAAGLPHCSAHGLRKAGATRLADAGASEWEVMAFLAHATPQEAATYTKQANRGRLADTGFAKLPGVKPERNVSNLPKKLGKEGV